MRHPSATIARLLTALAARCSPQGPLTAVAIVALSCCWLPLLLPTDLPTAPLCANNRPEATAANQAADLPTLATLLPTIGIAAAASIAACHHSCSLYGMHCHSRGPPGATRARALAALAAWGCSTPAGRRCCGHLCWGTGQEAEGSWPLRLRWEPWQPGQEAGVSWPQWLGQDVGTWPLWLGKEVVRFRTRVDTIRLWVSIAIWAFCAAVCLCVWVGSVGV